MVDYLVSRSFLVNMTDFNDLSIVASVFTSTTTSAREKVNNVFEISWEAFTHGRGQCVTHFSMDENAFPSH